MLGPPASLNGGSSSCRSAGPTATCCPWSSSATKSAHRASASWLATGSWGCMSPSCWSSASSCVDSSARSHTPSCLRSCRAWTVSSSSARTSSWCGRLVSWSFQLQCAGPCTRRPPPAVLSSTSSGSALACLIVTVLNQTLPDLLQDPGPLCAELGLGQDVRRQGVQ